MYTKCIQREVTISMAAKKTRKRKTSSAKKRTRTRQKDFAPFYKEIAVLVVFALFIFLFLSNFGICGYIGNSISTFFFGAFGTTHYIIPAVSFILAILLISNDYSSLAVKKTCFAILLLCMVSTIFQMIYNIEVRDAYSAFVFSGRTHRGGGYLGALICSILYKELGGAGSVLVVLLISVISLILVTERSLLSFLKKAVDFFTVEGYEEDIEERLAKKKRKAKEVSKEDKETAPRKKRSMHIPDLRSGRPKPSQASPMPPMEPEEKTKQTPIQKDFDDLIVQEETDKEPKEIFEPVQPNASKKSFVNKDKNTPSKPVEILPQVRTKEGDYKFPPVSLLEKGKKTAGNNKEELRQTAQKLQKTLEDFGVHVTITNISFGPSVTQFELHPEQGVKVSKIVNLADDIKLNLAAADIRIEAPIPGKAAIGIEIPNKHNQTVHFRDLIESSTFEKFKSRLAFAVGKDIGGKTVVTDLAKMPHLLIAGATGSGKSVCINTLIMSILYKASPEEVKLIMVDPKMVELSIYNGIPHLLIPVVTDPKKASGALNWAVAEMTNRYKKFTETGVRNIEGYNKKVKELQKSGEIDPETIKKMPQIVIIIDELADLMMVAPGEVEDAIVRLSQLARAAGIHLVIATQRPSVNVITGLIKANVPSRIAFSVSSGVDSRTIIDMNGAEKLLGKGDMLFYPAGYSKPVRVQGAFISDSEISDVVEFLKENEDVAVYDTEVTEKIESKLNSAAISQEKDEYFEAAARFVIEKDKASIGMIQRMFKVGFNRAARIVDQLADAGIVGPEEGTKPRKVLMSSEQLEAYFEEYL